MDRLEGVFIDEDPISAENNGNNSWQSFHGENKRLKIGEVFQLENKTLLLSCIRCCETFRYFTEFSLHIQEHYSQGDIANLKEVKEEPAVDILDYNDDFHSIVILDSMDEPEMEIKIECTEAQYETRSPAVFDGDRIEASSVCSDSMTSSSMDKVPNTSSSSYVKKSIHKSCANTVKIIKSQKTKVKRRKRRFPIQCEVCQEKFCGFRQLIFHRRIHLDEFPIHCRVCLNTFPDGKQRSVHEINCDWIRYECYVCKSTHQGKANLEYHMRSHSGIKPFKCLRCNRRFSMKHIVAHHIASVHEHKRPFSCEFCPRHYAHKSNLIKHKITMHGVENCKKNQSAVGAKHNRKRLRKPSKLSGNIKCEVCRKVFGGSQYLIYHRRTHLDEFSIYCRICLRTFSEEKPRSVHENNCDKVRYECYVCKSTIAYKAILESHMRVHSGIKPFKCPICNKIFSQKSIMKHHIESVHEHKKPFNCELCSMQFARKTGLNKHVIKIHGVKKREKNQLNVGTPKRARIKHEQ